MNKIVLEKFIQTEKEYLSLMDESIEWENDTWDVINWLPHRGAESKILFNSLHISQVKRLPKNIAIALKGTPLPPNFSNFVKALAVHFQRTKKLGYMSVRNYVNECRKLYLFMFPRNETSVASLSKWHFQQVVEYYKSSEYKNIYDAYAHLRAIADFIDRMEFCPTPILLNEYILPNTNNHKYNSIRERINDDERYDDDKLPSMEAIQAYALCTNNPINDDEEILIRTIDLLIAMGQRGNEVLYIPVDCIVEELKYDDKGLAIKDLNGQTLKNVGIRYYGEKGSLAQIHWLSELDIPFAYSAIDRLMDLTKEAREVAKWQETNPNKIFEFNDEEEIADIDLIKYLGFGNVYYLYLFLYNRNQIKPTRTDLKISRAIQSNKTFRAKWYKCGDIRKLFCSKINHNAFKMKVNGKVQTILKTSEILSIHFEGSYRFKRLANTNRLWPMVTQLKVVNGALGSVPGIESIFKRRNATKRNKYTQTLNNQFENLLLLTGAGSSIGWGKDGKVGKSMVDLWNDAETLLTKEVFTTLLSKIGYNEKWEDGSIVKNLEKVLSMATPAIPYISKKEIDIAELPIV